jgi:hypothetical protein
MDGMMSNGGPASGIFPGTIGFMTRQRKTISKSLPLSAAKIPLDGATTDLSITIEQI